MKSTKVSTRQIHSAGKLLVQYKLAKRGIDSSASTDDVDIDLIAQIAKNSKAYTIQVRVQDKPHKAGGVGKLAYGWYLPDASAADMVATVDLENDRVWLFRMSEFRKLAQQHSRSGRYQLYMHIDESIHAKHEISRLSQFDKYRFENRVRNLFLGAKT